MVYGPFSIDRIHRKKQTKGQWLAATVSDRTRSNTMMEFKGYIGRVEFDDEASVFHGEVINMRDVITFQGESVAELKKAFRDSVNDYLAFCKSRGEEPDKPFSGQFVTRIPPELHRQVNLAASLSGKSLNAWVSEQLQSAVARSGTHSGKKAKKKAARNKTGQA
jgi:predicted HicB family RNase H-like nuclease